MSEEKMIFCFGVGGERDEYHGNYHPATIYDANVENPYHHEAEVAEEMIYKAFEALPKEPEEYGEEDAGRGGWVRFDYEGLISGEQTEPIEVEE